MPGDTLLATDRLVSAGGRSTLDMQRDGNVVLRRKYLKRDGDEVVWSAGDWGHGELVPESAFAMQADGVLTLYPPWFTGKFRVAVAAWKAAQGRPAPWVRLVDDGYLEFLDGDELIYTLPAQGGITGGIT